jgi:hypothetical protein
MRNYYVPTTDTTEGRIDEFRVHQSGDIFEAKRADELKMKCDSLEKRMGAFIERQGAVDACLDTFVSEMKRATRSGTKFVQVATVDHAIERLRARLNRAAGGL